MNRSGTAICRYMMCFKNSSQSAQLSKNQPRPVQQSMQEFSEVS